MQLVKKTVNNVNFLSEKWNSIFHVDIYTLALIYFDRDTKPWSGNYSTGRGQTKTKRTVANEWMNKITILSSLPVMIIHSNQCTSSRVATFFFSFYFYCSWTKVRRWLFACTNRIGSHHLFNIPVGGRAINRRF